MLIFNEQQKADTVVADSLKSNAKWGSRDRHFIAENTYEIIRWWRLLKFCAEVNERKFTDEANFWKLAGAWLSLKEYELPDWPEWTSISPEKILSKKEEAENIRKIRESIPDWLDEKGEAEVPDWDREMHAMNEEASVFLRVNESRISVQDLLQQFEKDEIEAEPVPGLKNALRLLKRKNLSAYSGFRKGYFEIQDAGSQLIAEFVRPKPGEQILDACAGAGGKSLYMAELMENSGTILATDVHHRKLEELEKRAQRNYIKIIRAQKVKQLNETELAGWADKVLLDVPCSGSGVLKRNPDAKWKLQPEFLENIKKTQSDILDQYSRILKPGGKMVYATCSILPSENQQQVEKFLAREEGKDFKLVKDQKVLSSESGYDGFYMALLEKAK